jgi:maltose O-acetyltransferase
MSRLVERLERGIGRVRAYWLFRSATLGGGVSATGHLRVDNRGTLRIGRQVTFLGGMIPTRITVHPGALLEIGKDTLFNYGASIEVTRSLVIGERCMFASMIHLGGSLDEPHAPMVIGDDVWVAHGATVGPGLTVGEGSTVAAGSVVVRNVPPHSLALGNPARSVGLELVSRPAAP